MKTLAKDVFLSLRHQAVPVCLKMMPHDAANAWRASASNLKRLNLGWPSRNDYYESLTVPCLRPLAVIRSWSLSYPVSSGHDSTMCWFSCGFSSGTSNSSHFPSRLSRSPWLWFGISWIAFVHCAWIVFITDSVSRPKDCQGSYQKYSALVLNHSPADRYGMLEKLILNLTLVFFTWPSLQQGFWYDCISTSQACW